MRDGISASTTAISAYRIPPHLVSTLFSNLQTHGHIASSLLLPWNVRQEMVLDASCGPGKEKNCKMEQLLCVVEDQELGLEFLVLSFGCAREKVRLVESWRRLKSGGGAVTQSGFGEFVEEMAVEWKLEGLEIEEAWMSAPWKEFLGSLLHKKGSLSDDERVLLEWFEKNVFAEMVLAVRQCGSRQSVVGPMSGCWESARL